MDWPAAAVLITGLICLALCIRGKMRAEEEAGIASIVHAHEEAMLRLELEQDVLMVRMTGDGSSGELH